MHAGKDSSSGLHPLLFSFYRGLCSNNVRRLDLVILLLLSSKCWGNTCVPGHSADISLIGDEVTVSSSV